MNAKHVELLRRLEKFQLDSPEAALPFSARLARENQWTPAYTQRVIAEYKRFAFLAVAAGHPVSPSEDVDQAWHRHLTYTQDYWKIFCPEILGQPLHHQPTKGGHEEHEKFGDWYRQTLASYRELLGEEPPSDIWPTPEAREKEKHNFVRVDRDRNWVIRKPKLQFTPKFIAPPALAALVILCSGAMTNGANPFDWRGPDFLKFYALLFGVCFVLALWLRRKLRTPLATKPLNVPELDGYTTAYLNGGKVLAVNTAIANLTRQKTMRIDAKDRNITSLVPEPNFEHDLEKAVYRAAESNSGSKIGGVREAAMPVMEGLMANLQARGLVVTDAQARKARWIPLLVVIPVIAVGIAKIFVGLSRGKPIGFLIGLCAVSLIASLIIFARRPLRSRRGDAVLKKMQERHVGARRLGRGLGVISGAEFAGVVGLFGMSALAGTELDDLRKSLMPPGGDAGGCGSSCGGGCGGGGCGGGCGGCGG